MPVPPNFNAYTNRLGCLCLAWSVYPAGGRIQLTLQERDGQKTDKQKTAKKDKLGPVAPRGVDPRSQIFQDFFQEAPYIFHPRTIWV